jgi:hypothetical protein
VLHFLIEPAKVKKEMTKKEHIERNIGMTFDFLRHLLEHPGDIDSIPDGAELDFIDKDAPFKATESGRGKKVARYKVEHVFERLRN